MTIITKAGLAADLGVSKARVSQYVKRGLPVRSDGKVDREAAVKWVADNYPDFGRSDTPGVKRAATLAKAAKPKASARPSRSADTRNPVDDAMLITAASIVGRAGSIAAAMAVELGLPMRTAYALDRMMAVELATVADRFLVGCGLDRFEHYSIIETIPPEEMQPDWPALAAKAGEPVDEDAWDGLVEALPWHKALGAAGTRVGT